MISAMTVVTDTPRWLTRKEAAQRLGVSLRTLDTYVSTGRLTRQRVMGSTTVRFWSTDVDALVRPDTH